MAQKKNVKQNTMMDTVKKNISYAADMASLKLLLNMAKSDRKEAYTRLGALSYTKYRPRKNGVTEDIESAISKTVREITILNQEIAELELRIKILKTVK
ncbi:MAG: hypothetical protein IKV00_08095 [Clostridia bacterium]|nr:hypothetical protein [Clostridia bacterium]